MSTLINNKTKKGFKMNVYKKFVNSPKMSVLNHKWLDAEKSVLTKGLPNKSFVMFENFLLKYTCKTETTEPT